MEYKTKYSKELEDIEEDLEENEDESESEEEEDYDREDFIKKKKTIGADDEEDEDDEDDEDEDVETMILNSKKDDEIHLPVFNDMISVDNDDDEEEEDDDDDDNYLQKFEENIEKNIISDFHPELSSHNYEEIETMCMITRDANNAIIDPLHQTLPFVTRYEKAHILGVRAKQINSGASIFVDVEPDIIDGFLIALKEFEEKKIPFIVRRPFADGTCEYWRLSDLEILA